MRERYEAERRSEHRTFARDHSFEEWCEEQKRKICIPKWCGCSRCVVVEGYPNVLTHRTW